MQQPWHQRHRALLCLGVLMLIQWFAWQLLPTPAERWHSQDVKAHLITVSKPDAIILDPSKQYAVQFDNWPSTMMGLISNGAGSQSVNLSIKTDGANSGEPWLLQYTTPDSPAFDEGIIYTNSLRPILSTIGAITELTWHLPAPAASFRILIPKDTRFTIEKLLLAGLDSSSWHTWRQALVYLCFALNAALFIAWLAQIFSALGRVCSKPAFLSLLLLSIHGITMVWLLPPFLGPDENRHWKEAVKLYRTEGQEGSVLARLPVILDAESPRWRSDRPFHAMNLHAIDHPDKRGENKGVGYVKHWGYPIVGLVSLLFPPVHTVNEAIVFFYACRVTALLLLLSLVALAWRWGLGSWTLVIFLSFPLVLQQCVIISTDTVHNLGTLLAILLFRRHQLTRTTASWLALFLICCLVIVSKPPIYLTILILPAWFLPWSALRRPAVWAPLFLGSIALIAAGIWCLWRILDTEGFGEGDLARKQLAYVFTGPGFARFTLAALEYPSRFLNPTHWWEPLGWLDTNLTDLHKALLWISLAGALAIDLARWITWLRSTGPSSLWNLLEPLLACLPHLLFVWWSLALIWYLTISEYQSLGIVGMQIRYMIPVALLFLTLPPAMLTPSIHRFNTSRLIWPSIFLLVLAIARAIQLSIDLHYRYWG